MRAKRATGRLGSGLKTNKLGRKTLVPRGLQRDFQGFCYRAEDVRRDRAVRVERAVATCRRVADFRGLPPSIPFLREDAAFRFDRTEPRHAGQKETRSILWI